LFNLVKFLIREYGDRELFEKQKRYLNMKLEDEQVLKLKRIIEKYKKGLEQEGLTFERTIHMMPMN